VTEKQIAKEIETGEEANELYGDTLQQAEELIETLDLSWSLKACKESAATL